MARFQFTLAPLLRLRIHAEDQRKRELGYAIQARSEAEAAIDTLEKDRDNLISQFSLQTDFMDPMARVQLGIYLQSMAHQIEAAKIHLQQRSQAVLSATDALRQAVQQRKILERLREIREEEHRVGENRKQQKVLDEHSAHFLRRENANRSIHASEL